MDALVVVMLPELCCLQALDDILPHEFPLVFKVRCAPTIDGGLYFDIWVALAPFDLILVAERVQA